MRIGFDAKRLYNNFTGLGNHSRFIVEALSEFYPDNDYLLFTPKVISNSDTQFFLKAKNIQTIVPPSWISNLQLNSFWRSFMISNRVNNQGVSIYHGLSHELPIGIPKKIKTVVTVHDLIFLRYPQFYNRIDVLIYKAKIIHACKVATSIIAISEQTKQDIIEFLKIDADKISVVYQGCHSNFTHVLSQRDLFEVKQKYNLPDEFILNVGTIELRKNALQIVKALGILKGKIDTPLVIIGRATKYIEEIRSYAKQHGLENRVIYIHNVVFSDLPAIYRLSRVFVYPSLIEGFGIPLIEAITCGVPVITSTASCFNEAAGPASLYVDCKDDQGLANQLQNVIENEALRQRMISQSSLYIKKFQPQGIARDLQYIYSSILAS